MKLAVCTNPTWRSSILIRVVMLVLACGWLCRPAMAVDEDIPQTLTKLLERQRDAWNHGDLDGFMEVYWRSPELTFSSGGTTTRGWQATLDRYDQKYRVTKQMGKLTFSDLEVTALNDSSAFMLGRWHLDNEGVSSGGNFTLIWRKIDGHWRIVHDHSSALIPASEVP